MTGMNDRESLEYVFDALGRVLESAMQHQEAAERQQAIAEDARERMVAASEKLERMAGDLKGQVSREISSAVPGMAEGAATIFTSKLEAADRLAEAAAARYRSCVRWAVWKIAVGAAAAGLAAMGAGAWVVMRSVPSYAEMQALRAEHAALKQNVAKLEQLGGRAQFTRCLSSSRGSRLCIKIDESAPRYEDGFRIIAGY